MSPPRRSSLLLLGSILAGRALYLHVARLMLRRTFARLREGDIGPLLRFYAKDVEFHFPGEHSWSADLHDKGALTAWVERFAATGLQLYADEIVISGPPWRTTLVVCGHDHLTDEEGRVVYENRAVIWGSASWGKLKRYEVYEDTQKVVALDEYLVAKERTGSRGSG